MSWKKVSEILCNRKLSARVKGKMYKGLLDQPRRLKAKAYIYKKNSSGEGYALRNKTLRLFMQIIIK